jgi:hypothetical protein
MLVLLAAITKILAVKAGNIYSPDPPVLFVPATSALVYLNWILLKTNMPRAMHFSWAFMD